MDCVAETVTKMFESLPEHIQKKLLDEITPIISEAFDEAKWESQYRESSLKLAEFAQNVKNQVAAEKSFEMDFSKL